MIRLSGLWCAKKGMLISDGMLEGEDGRWNTAPRANTVLSREGRVQPPIKSTQGLLVECPNQSMSIQKNCKDARGAYRQNVHCDSQGYSTPYEMLGQAQSLFSYDSSLQMMSRKRKCARQRQIKEVDEHTTLYGECSRKNRVIKAEQKSFVPREYQCP